jgi:4-amino-4-deoxy-L-arabinose transferase-like glycosyltransferase
MTAERRVSPSGASRGREAERAGADRGRWAQALALYLFVAIVSTLPGLGSTDLIKMEGMVADVSAAMLKSGDYLVPRLYGEIYTYKPPLVYWLTAVALRLGGRTEWALRLPSALAIVLMGLVVLLLVGRLTRPRVGLYAGWAAITSMMIFSKTKLAEFDAVLACAVGIAVVAACYNLAQECRRGSFGVWLACYLALGAAFLAKGPPALMAFGPGLLAAVAVTGRWRELVGWRHLVGLAIFSAIVGGFLWQLWDAAGAAAFTQPVAEARARGFDWTLAALPRTLLKPVMAFVGFLPWSLAWRASLPRWGGRSGEVGTANRDASRPVRCATAGAGPGDENGFGLERVSLAFLVTGVLIFMAVPTYEPRYLLPLSGAGAVVAALGLERAVASRRFGWLATGLATLCSGLLVAAGFGAPLPARTRLAIAVAGGAGMIATWVVVSRWPRQRVVLALLVTAFCGWVAETAVLRPDRARARNAATLAAELDKRLPREETLWVYGTPEAVGTFGNILFYLDRPVRVFLDVERGPEAGAHVIVPAAAEAEIRHLAPAFAARLEWLHTTRYREGALELSRLER